MGQLQLRDYRLVGGFQQWKSSTQDPHFEPYVFLKRFNES